MNGALLALLILCVAVSFLMSGMEAGVFALSRWRIRQQMKAGSPRARALYAYLENPEDFLWTILVGNILANFVVIAIGVAGIHGGLGNRPGWALGALLGMGVGFYALCELLPKMLFRLNPIRLCLLMSRPFGAVYLALRPIVMLVAWSANLVLRWSGGRPFTGQLFGNRDEMRQVMQETAQGMTSEERGMINRVLDLQNLTVQQVTVPMSKVACVSAQAPMREAVALARDQGHIRLPVWQAEGNRRRIVGMVNLISVLYQPDFDPQRTAREYVRPALYLDAAMRLEVALRQMQRTGQRLAVVLAPDKTELGVVSLQDMLEVIFGEVSW